MNGALRIVTLFGIPVRIHWTFMLIFVYLFFTGANQNWDITNTLWSVLFVLVLFFCVVLHEFGHALTARKYGVRTRDIILSPIGGVARLDHLPEKPVQEFLVAIAGPAVNIGIALLISPYLFTIDGSEMVALFQSIIYPESNYIPVGLNQVDYFLCGLLLLNIMLAIFNLFPAFPMDGGRVLRALLSTKLSRYQATKIAVYLGQVLAVGLALYGVFMVQNYFYLFIGAFVFLAAASEYKMVRNEYVLRQHHVEQATRKNFIHLYVTDTIAQAIQQLPEDGQQGYLILNNWQDVVGILT
ncbi:MAG: site-2 protease family protein, partial [Saprospiraceae bacterium]|nr:site-2 protease family protein [Saprospiraceae bacterium]